MHPCCFTVTEKSKGIKAPGTPLLFLQKPLYGNLMTLQLHCHCFSVPAPFPSVPFKCLGTVLAHAVYPNGVGRTSLSGLATS